MILIKVVGILLVIALALYNSRSALRNIRRNLREIKELNERISDATQQ